MSELFLFTPRTNIQEALELDDRVVHALKSLGLKCVLNDEMCVAATVETLADAALYHNLPLDRILLTLNELRIPRRPEPGPEGQAP